MAIKYWVNNGGLWSDTSHWSITSGGSGGAGAPSANDSVVIDTNSFSQANQVISIPNDYSCKSMKVSGISISETLEIVSGKVLTVDSMSVIGDSTNKFKINSSISGAPASISCANYQVNVKNCVIKDIAAVGGAQFNAVQSTNVSGNSGVNFVDSVKVASLSPVTSEVAGFMTPQLLSKVEGIESGAQVNTVTSVAGNTGDVSLTDMGLNNVDNTSDANKPISDATQEALDLKADASDVYTKSEVYTKTETDTAIANLVDSAPETLNTLNELSNALGDDPNFATTVANAIGGKVEKVTGKGLSTNDYDNTAKDIVDGVTTAISGKVDKVAGKGLSTEDFTTTLKDKLTNIQEVTSLDDTAIVITNPSSFTKNLDANTTDVHKLAQAVDGLSFATPAQGTKADNALPASSYTAADVVAKANANGGVNADTLDGKHASEFATATQGTKADDAIPKSSFTAAGDIMYATAAGTPTVLPKGTNGQILKLNGGLPAWAELVGGNATVASGSYTGDGTANREINVGFIPKIVVIQNTTNMSLWVTLLNNGALEFVGNAYPSTNSYTHISANGFHVQTSTNTTGQTYNYIALK
jgi:hypothetical protein